MSTSTSPTSIRNPILWGAYLACSWTWCIGMFLPALLLRDMGWAGFLIFAIPNVVGATAMGWLLKTRLDSTRFVENHPDAIWWFSSITLAFHLFWLLWLTSFIRSALPLPAHVLTGALGATLAFALIATWTIRRSRAPQLAALLLTFSLGVLIASFCTTNATHAELIQAAPQSRAPLWMLPVTLFGFLLCPYLDITFHHARQQLDTRKNARLGFSIGFIAFFFLMILLTTRYAGVITGALSGRNPTPFASPWLAAGILTHLLCQWLFTVHIHLNRIHTIPGARPKRPLLLLLVVASGLIGLAAPRLPSHAGLTGGEIIYRLFMSAYGLLFPAFILYRVILKRKWRMMWIATALASPMFWMGFIERQTIWLIPGIGIVLLGTAIKKAPRPST